MADPLSTINIDQLTNSVSQVFASANPELEYRTPSTDSSTAVSTVSTITSSLTSTTSPALSSPTILTDTSEHAIPAMPVTAIPASYLHNLRNPPMYSVVMLVGGQPTLLAMGDQHAGTKLIQAIPVTAPFLTDHKSVPTSLPSASHATNVQDKQNSQKSLPMTQIPGQIPIQPKPPPSSSVPSNQINQPFPTMMALNTTQLPYPLIPHFPANTPLSSSAMVPCSSTTGEITYEHSQSMSHLDRGTGLSASCMTTPQLISSLTAPLLQPPTSLPALSSHQTSFHLTSVSSSLPHTSPSSTPTHLPPTSMSLPTTSMSLPSTSLSLAPTSLHLSSTSLPLPPTSLPLPPTSLPLPPTSLPLSPLSGASIPLPSLPSSSLPLSFLPATSLPHMTPLPLSSPALAPTSLSHLPSLHDHIHVNTASLVPDVDLTGSGGGNSLNKALLDNVVLEAQTPNSFTECASVGEPHSMTGVHQLGLDVLSPSAVYQLPSDKETRGETPINGYLLSSAWSGTFFDSIIKGHELSLEKAVTTKDGKDPMSANELSLEASQSSNTVNTNQFFCLYCNECSDKECTFHHYTCSRVFDQLIETRARLSLPDILTLRQSSVSSDLTGVFAKSSIQPRVVFGPLAGEILADDSDQKKKHNFSVWKVFYDNKIEAISLADENTSNWMGFVKPARTILEQNIVAYQLGREIYFITRREIVKDDELLLWYAKDYAKSLGLNEIPGANQTCDLCSKSFPNPKALGRHHKYAHADMSTRKWKCEYCSHGFNSHSKLKSHVLSHLGVKPHECLTCGKKFTEKPNLTRHMYIHTGERNFACKYCGRSFRQKAHMQAHTLVHTGEKTLKCRFCEKLFARTSDLRQHEYQHTREKVFTCSQCNKVFYKLQSFKKHSKIHAGQKDFECHKCEKRFATRYHVNRHLLTCKGTKGADYTLDSEDPELVALNIESQESVLPLPPEPHQTSETMLPLHSQTHQPHTLEPHQLLLPECHQPALSIPPQPLHSELHVPSDSVLSLPVNTLQTNYRSAKFKSSRKNRI